MRVLSIGKDDSFCEYKKTKFEVDHEESILETWFETNPGAILEDEKLLVIERQVQTNLNTWIDLLAIDIHGNSIIVELKRDKTPRDTIAQAIEYSSFVADLDLEALEGVFRSYINDSDAVLAQYHKKFFQLTEDDIVVFTADQRLIITGQEIVPALRQSARYLNRKGIRANCLEFTYFETDTGLKLMTSELVVDDKEAVTRGTTSGASLPIITQNEFLASLNNFGTPVFEQVLKFAEEQSHSINWGTKGFSIGVKVEDVRIPICYGYPPDAVFKQSVYTALVGAGGLRKRLNESQRDQISRQIGEYALQTGIFENAGNEFKCVIDRTFTEQEIQKIISFLSEIANLATTYLSEHQE